MLTHLYKTVLPELFAVLIFIGIEADVTSAIFAAPGVAEPNVVPGSSNLKSRGYLVLIDNPGVGGAENPMLKEYCWFLSHFEEAFLLNSKHVQNVSIIGLYGVTLVSKSILLCYLLKCLEVVREEDWNLVSIAHGRVTVIYACSFRVINFHFAVIASYEWNSRGEPFLPSVYSWKLYSLCYVPGRID